MLNGKKNMQLMFNPIIGNENIGEKQYLHQDKCKVEPNDVHPSRPQGKLAVMVKGSIGNYIGEFVEKI